MNGENELDIETVFSWLESRAGKLDGVVVTGGEPCVHSDLPEFLSKIRDLGFKIKLDTNGSRPEMLEKCIDLELVDFIAMDIKASWDNYSSLCGVKVEREAITRTVELIGKSDIPHLFRTTFVPPLMKENELESIRTYIPEHSEYIVQDFRSETALDPNLR